jgi:hypothetical protein
MARPWCAAAVALAVMAVSPGLSRGTLARAVTPGDPMIRRGGQALATARGIADGGIRSSNWSGYAVSGGDGTYRSVSASWTEPAVKCTSGDRYASFWIGLDGYSSHSVEQTGTASDCAGTTAVYSGWYEMYPGSPVYFRNKVKPRDHLTASVTFSGSDTYRLVLRDTTRGWMRTVTRHEAGLDRSSAEVITEAPSSADGVVPLADFGTVRFTVARVDGTLLQKLHPAKIVMVDGDGLGKDSTSPVSRAGAFRNTWIRSN